MKKEKPVVDPSTKGKNNDNAVIYLRVSTDMQTESSQLKPCRKFCSDRGLNVVAVLKDHAKSAYRNVYRKDYEKAREMIRNREIGHVVVFSLDRWIRQGPKEMRATHRFFKACDARLHSVREYWVEGLQSMPSGLSDVFIPYMYDMLAWLAREESKKISDRVKSSKKFQKAVDKGRVGRPDIPGYAVDEIKKYLGLGKSYRWIHRNVVYKGRHGKHYHPSLGKIAEIKKSVFIKGN